MELNKEQTPVRVSSLKIQVEGGFCHPEMPGGKKGVGRGVLQVAPRSLSLSLSLTLSSLKITQIGFPGRNQHSYLKLDVQTGCFLWA